MSNILLICSAGISTGVLVRNMNKAAQNISFDGKVWSVGIFDAKEALSDADIVLLGPQIGHLLETIQDAAGKDKRVSMMDKEIYASGDGERALEYAISLLEKEA